MGFVKGLYIKATDWLSEAIHHRRALFLFEKLIYLWLLAISLNLYPLIDLLWSNESPILGVYLQDGLINNFFLKLTYVKSAGHTIYYIHIISVLLSLFGVLGRIPKIAVWFTAWMFYYGAPTAYNAGYVLAINYSFFLIFTGWKRNGTLNVILNNLVWIALIVQLILIYFEAAMYKWSGSSWWMGESIWNLSFWEVYFNQGFGDFLHKNAWLAVALNYCAFAYQSLFAFMVWWKKFKLPFLLIGVLFHVFIMIFMNLPYFGLIMILGYVLFLSEEQLKNILKYSPLKKSAAKKTDFIADP